MQLPASPWSVVIEACPELQTYRMAPGSTITSAAAMVWEMGKVLESTIRMEPPARGVMGTLENSKE